MMFGALHPASGFSRFLIIFAIALFWIFVVKLNNIYLFGWTALENWVHIIYFPAGIKLIIVMLFGWVGVTGLFFGSVYNFSDTFAYIPPQNIVILSALYSVAPMLARLFFEKLSGKHYPWIDIRFTDIISLIVGSSLLSGIFITLGLFTLTGRSPTCPSLIGLLIGDVLGTFIIFIFIYALLAMKRR